MQRNSNPEGISITTIEIENFLRPRFRETYIPHQVYIWKPLRRHTAAHRSSALISYLRLSSRSDSWTTGKERRQPFCATPCGNYDFTNIFISRSTLARHSNLIRLKRFYDPDSSISRRERIRFADCDGCEFSYILNASATPQSPNPTAVL